MAAQLQADESGRYRQELLERLAQYKQNLEELAPMAPNRDTFNIIEQLKQAVQKSETILTQ